MLCQLSYWPVCRADASGNYLLSLWSVCDLQKRQNFFMFRRSVVFFLLRVVL